MNKNYVNFFEWRNYEKTLYQIHSAITPLYRVGYAN